MLQVTSKKLFSSATVKKRIEMELLRLKKYMSYMVYLSLLQDGTSEEDRMTYYLLAGLFVHKGRTTFRSYNGVCDFVSVVQVTVHSSEETGFCLFPVVYSNGLDAFSSILILQGNVLLFALEDIFVLQVQTVIQLIKVKLDKGRRMCKRGHQATNVQNFSINSFFFLLH